MTTRTLLSSLAAGALLLAASAANAAFLDKPIMMIVAYGANGGTDVTARLLTPFIEKHLGGGARILVVNRPGAGGEIGFATIADAAPDGHTLGFINSPNVITIPIERKASYTLDRLDPLVNIVDDPSVLTVHADSPHRTPADLVAYAKANPRAVIVGTTGVGSDDHLAMMLLQRQAGAVFGHASFPGSAENHRAMVARKIEVAGQNLGEALRARASEPVRILGVMSRARWDMAPDLPTFKEQGFDITMASLRGIAAPKGLPADVRTKLVEAILKAANDPEFQTKARETFQPLRILGPEAFAAELKALDTDFRMLWAEAPWLKK